MRRRIAGSKASSSPSEPSARRGGARRIGSRKSHAFQRSASVESFVTSAAAAPTSVRYACRMARGILADDTRRPSPSKSAVDDGRRCAMRRRVAWKAGVPTAPGGTARQSAGSTPSWIAWSCWRVRIAVGAAWGPPRRITRNRQDPSYY